MRLQSLQTRFLLAGSLLVLATIAGGAWSVITFGNLSATVGETLRDSQRTIDLTTNLAEILEREDDALLLALSGKLRNARSDVAEQRQEFDQSYSRLLPLLSEADEREAAVALRDHADGYRHVGDALLAKAGRPEARELYHEQVNPALRKAVADCGRIRELNFRSMQQVGLLARNEARRATGVAAGVALIALGLTTLVMVRLAQVILRPIRELTRSVEAIRRNEFKSRVAVDSEDELGLLAAGFNRMAETLGEYRESSLGELLLAKATLESTLAALPDAVIVVDPDGQIVSKNPLAEQVLKPIGGHEARRFGELPLGPDVLRVVEETLRSGRASPATPDLGRAISVDLNGRPAKMLLTVVPILEFLPHRPGAAIVLADVTEFARLDELRGEVVAVASHELKTPLTALQMNLLLLQEKADNLTARQREILAAAVHGGEELAATIEELLDVTRIEAGQLRLAQEPIDLAGVIEQVVRGMHQRYADAEVSLRIVRDVKRAVVRGDTARLKLVFVNLLTNALKYTPRHGDVAIHLASVQNAVPGAKPRLQITVTDTGPGIPAELRERVFDKFFRVEDQLPDGPKGVRGTGIGLFLAREIIRAHGGTITCTAGEGDRGTRIAILLDADGDEVRP
jgi:NtrC-family two-component system sensor histidine kinase KinB